MPTKHIKEKQWTVYGLREIGQSVVRYVGFTRYKINKRVREHKNRLKDDKASGLPLCYRLQWIQSVLDKGNDIESVVIEQGCGEELGLAREIHWIAWYRKIMGPLLTNTTDGGDGITGYEYTPEHRALKSKQFKGVPKTPEHVANQAAAQRGKVISQAQRENSSRIAKEMWNDPEKAAKMKESRRLYLEINGSPNKGKKISEKHRLATQEGLTRYWADPENRKKHSEKQQATASRKRYLQAIPFLYEYAYGEPFPE